MQKIFKLIISVCVIGTSFYGAFAQTETFKDVVLDGKPARLNIETGIITFYSGEVVKSKSALKIKDSINESNTVINKNLITTQDNLILENYNGNLDTIPKSFQKELPNKIPEIKSITEANNKVFASNDDENYNTSNFHKVQKGETLYALSKRYNTSLGELKQSNNLETTLIKVGQTLRVRNFDEDYSKKVWIVSKGDTLYNIAKRNSTTVEAIKTLNGLVSNLIKVGQTLQLK